MPNKHSNRGKGRAARRLRAKAKQAAINENTERTAKAAETPIAS